MSGSMASLIVMPIVIALALTGWISLVYYAMFHPGWKHHATPPKTEVAGGAFEALHGGRQLMPIWGEPVDAIPGQRPATAAETYQAADAQTANEPGATPAASGAGATATATAPAPATGSRPPGASGPAGSGWPPR